MKPDGGPAFPNITPDMLVDGGPGMSLRQWYAGMALCGLMNAGWEIVRKQQLSPFNKPTP